MKTEDIESERKRQTEIDSYVCTFLTQSVDISCHNNKDNIVILLLALIRLLSWWVLLPYIYINLHR